AARGRRVAVSGSGGVVITSSGRSAVFLAVTRLVAGGRSRGARGAVAARGSTIGAGGGIVGAAVSVVGRAVSTRGTIGVGGGRVGGGARVTAGSGSGVIRVSVV